MCYICLFHLWLISQCCLCLRLNQTVEWVLNSWLERLLRATVMVSFEVLPCQLLWSTETKPWQALVRKVSCQAKILILEPLEYKTAVLLTVYCKLQYELHIILLVFNRKEQTSFFLFSSSVACNDLFCWSRRLILPFSSFSFNWSDSLSSFRADNSASNE